MKEIKSNTTTIFQSRWKRFAVEAAAATVAVIGGIEAFFLVFSGPGFVSRILFYLWGFIGFIPACFAGWYIGGVLRQSARRVLLNSEATTKDRVYCLVWLVVTVIAVFLLIFGYSSIWSEDVKLSDGREISVRRVIKLSAGGDELNPWGKYPKLHILKFRNPDDPSEWIEWKSTKFWGTWLPEYPLVLDKEQGVFVVYSTTGTSSACKYRYVDKQWQEEAIPPVIEVIPANLLVGDYKGRPGRVTLEIKKKKNADVYFQRRAKIGPKIERCG